MVLHAQNNFPFFNLFKLGDSVKCRCRLVLQRFLGGLNSSMNQQTRAKGVGAGKS